MRSGAGRGRGLRTALGLPLASAAVMGGIVWAANPGATGAIGVAGGIAVAAAGALAARRFFRAT